MTTLRHRNFLERRKRSEMIKLRGDKDPFGQVRKAVFARTKARTERGVRGMPMLDVYLRHLTEAAARGEVDAIRETLRLMDLLEKAELLHQAPRPNPQEGLVHERIAEQKRRQEIGGPQIAGLFLRMREDFRAQYEAIYGALPDFDTRVPYWLREDLAKLEEQLPSLLRKLRRQRPKDGDSPVGYGRPPVETRWQPGQSGNRPGTSRKLPEAWEPFRAGLMRVVPVTSDGRRTRSTTIAVAVTRLFHEAMKGTKGARRQVWALLTKLYGLNLLSPPEKPPRRRRATRAEKEAGAEYAMLLKVMLVPPLKKQMTEMYTKAYGPVPAFTTEAERSLPAPDEVAGFTRLSAESQELMRNALNSWAKTDEPDKEAASPKRARAATGKVKPAPARVRRRRADPLEGSAHV